jgi:UDP-3-O-[3-hydroxymyristoyl] glucosamine N-acyltransferase
LAGIDHTAVVAVGARVDPSASVGPHCAIGPGVTVGPRSVLHAGVVLYEGVTLGADCVLHARCVVAAASVLGDRVILQPGVVIGGSGFGYVGAEGGGLRHVYDVGRVVVEDDVEIGANSTVDRGTIVDTRIGRGTKIDNLVQIGHNSQIGEHVVIAAQVGMGGSTRVEDGSAIFGQAGLAGHLRVGPDAVVGARCGVHKDVAPGAHVHGYPQRDSRAWRRESAALARLPELLRRVRRLEKRDEPPEEGG